MCFMIKIIYPESVLLTDMFFCMFCLSNEYPDGVFFGIQNVCDLLEI